MPLPLLPPSVLEGAARFHRRRSRPVTLRPSVGRGRPAPFEHLTDADADALVGPNVAAEVEGDLDGDLEPLVPRDVMQAAARDAFLSVYDSFGGEVLDLDGLDDDD